MTGTDFAIPVLGGGRVLIVEDGEDAAAALTAVLRLHGFDARSARTASEGVAAVAATRPHVVVVDLELPDADGCDLIRRLRATPNPPNVVVVTGVTDPDRRKSAREAGAAAYLLKPTEPQDLVALLHRLCAARFGDE